MLTGNARVDSWLARDDDDDASIVSEYIGRAQSEYGDFDDSRFRLPEEEVTEEVVSDSAVEDVRVALATVAESAHRKAVSGLHRTYMRGRMLDNPDYSHRQVQPQRFFRLEGFMQLSTLEDMSLIDALMVGPVRTRLGAQTGMGKTMKLPGLIASKCGLRVLQLEFDNDLAALAMQAQKKLYKIPGSAKAWSRVKKAHLACMSYDDFRGAVLSANRERLFEDFDVFYMDEAHCPMGVSWSAKQLFASYAKEHNSLLMASATVSSIESNNEVATTVGKFTVEREPLSLDAAIASGRLVTEHLRDRTQVLVASDEDAAKLYAYYEEMGISVRILDRASTTPDREAVVKAFSVPTSVTPRVVVTTENYGTGFNLPLSYVISTCTRRVYEFDTDNALIEREVPLMRKEVVQHQGRVGRGLATGSGGWLLSPVVTADKELLASEALDAYLTLVAANIKPRPGLFDSVTRVLPKGINASVARMLLRSTLPSGLAVRYLGSDGRFASKFLDGIKLFHQTGEVMRKSKDEYPVGYENWIEETVGGYFEGDESATRTTLKVPFKSPPGLKIQMHTIAAVSERYLTMDYWSWFDEDEESDNEEIGVRTKITRKAVPRMPEAPVVEPAESVATAIMPWQYDVNPGDAAVKRSRRRGMSWNANGEGRMAVTTLVRALAADDLGASRANPVAGAPDHQGQVAYALPLEDESEMIPVKSAGGGKILLVSEKVHKCFVDGVCMTPEAAVVVLRHIVDIKAVERFAKSTVFDNWSSAWLCWFDSFASDGVFSALKAKGLHSDAVKLLGMLYDRFRAEVLSVAASSNLYRDKLGGFFRSKPSVSKFVSAVRKGKLPIAQSDQFVMRVLRIKDAYDKAIMAIELSGVFAPSLVTGAQRRLPIRDRARQLQVIDEDVVSREAGTTVDVNASDSRWRR